MSNIIVDKLGYISYFTFFFKLSAFGRMKETTPSSLWPDYLCTLIYLYQDRFQWSISEVTEKYAFPCILKHDICTYEIDTCYL